ncbi:MAG: hypothetical protein ACFFAY_15525 [Promethearchaeota archaeon]
MAAIEIILNRALVIEESIAALESISQRLSRMELLLERLVMDYDEIAETPPSSSISCRTSDLKKLRLLLEEIRISLDDVESETDDLIARVTIIENLRDRAQ